MVLSKCSENGSDPRLYNTGFLSKFAALVLKGEGAGNWIMSWCLVSSMHLELTGSTRGKGNCFPLHWKEPLSPGKPLTLQPKEVAHIGAAQSRAT